MIVLVSGPWDRFFLTQHIGDYLAAAGWADEVYMLVHGDEPGMDSATKSYARANQFPFVEFPRQRGYGKAAAHFRNAKMVEFLTSMQAAGHRVGALVVPGPKCTDSWDVQELCKAAGIKVVVDHSLLEGAA